MLAGRLPTDTSHHSTPEPAALPEDLLLARYVLVRRDGHQPPLSPTYDGPYVVLERSLRFFKIKIGNRIDKVSTLRLKPCHTPADTVIEPAQPPRRGHPPKPPPPTSPAPPPTSQPTPPAPPPLSHSAPLPGHPTPPPPRKEACHFPLSGRLTAADTFPPFWSPCTQHGAAILIRNLTRYRLV